MDRRRFLLTAAGLAACREPKPKPLVPKGHASTPPKVPFGVQVGDVSESGAVVWSRADRKAQMKLEWWADGGKKRLEIGPTVDAESDFTGVVELDDLPRGARIDYALSFVGEAESEAITGSFRTAGSGDVTFAWSGDTCGQGHGIDLDRGGLRVYEAIRKTQPDFFLHSGDLIYADGPIVAELALPGGGLFRNVVTQAKSKVAETLDDFRGNFAYHLLDENVRRFHREVPLVVQWDDHEIHNDWWPGQTLADDRYTERKVPVLAARARRALFEYTPIRRSATRRIHRVVRRGPLVDLFVLDARSHRAPNGPNLEASASDTSALLGDAQLGWLFEELAASQATWKVFALDQPIGLVVRDRAIEGVEHHDGIANGDAGAPKGRELEILRLLRFLEAKNLRNFVFLTADVHYAAAHEYDAARAKVGPFPKFWELVAGPLHAGGFGPNALDETFGPKVVFQRVPPVPNQPPIGPWPSFGTVHVDEKTHAMTVRLHDGEGGVLFERTLLPA